MRIEVRLFANLADYLPAGARQGTTLELPEGSTLGEVVRRLAIPDEVPRLMLVNGDDAAPDRRLRPGDVVSIVPPLAGGSAMDVTDATGLYRTMLRIRRTEERIRDLYAAGRMPGFIHLSIGQEAVAAGVCAPLRRDDSVTSTHRGHGHYLAKGGSLSGLIAELYGKATGCCRGKGGSMHIADVPAGYLGANGVLTAGLSIACGVGLSAKMRGTDQVCVALFGDGAANRGPFHEAVNLAAVWTLPVVFVCENNWWASTTAFAASTAGGSIAARAAGYGIPGCTVDGNDALAVADAAASAVARARAGAGPSLVEARTVRWQGHFEGDPQGYREKAEVAEGRRTDPLVRLAEALRAAGSWDERWAKATEEAILAEIDAAVAFAEASPAPTPEAALADLFVDDPGPGP